jgi:hypothetical protein
MMLLTVNLQRAFFEAYLPLAGAAVLSTATLPDDFMTLAYQ